MKVEDAIDEWVSVLYKRAMAQKLTDRSGYVRLPKADLRKDFDRWVSEEKLVVSKIDRTSFTKHLKRAIPDLTIHRGGSAENRVWEYAFTLPAKGLFDDLLT